MEVTGLRLKKYRKVIFILTIITTIIAIMGAGFKLLMTLILKNRFNMDIKDASSVGIIGSADGPTSIIISNKPYSGSITMVAGVLSVIGIIYLIVTGRDK